MGIDSTPIQARTVFRQDTAPAKESALWLDTKTAPATLKQYDGGTAEWVKVSSSIATAQTTPPETPDRGDLWQDLSLTPPTLKTYTGTAWETYGPTRVEYSGAGTYDIPIRGDTLRVYLKGAGGGGGSGTPYNNGGNGGEGGYVITHIPTELIPNETVTLTLGAGGNGAAPEGNPGGSGEQSTFGVYLTAEGGGGGGGGGGVNGGPGGDGSDGTSNRTTDTFGGDARTGKANNGGSPGGTSPPGTADDGGDGACTVVYL